MSRDDLLFPPDATSNASAPTLDVVRVVYGHRWLIGMCVLVATVVTCLGAMRLPPTYRAGAKILVQTEQQATPAFFSGLASYSDRRDLESASRRLENEMGLVESLPLSAQVVDELGLGWTDVYHPPATHLSRAITEWAAPSLERLFGITIDPPSRTDIVQAFQASLQVAPTESKGAETTSSIIALSLRGPRPAILQAALDRLIRLYLDIDRRLSEEAGVKALGLVRKQVDEAEREVATAEDRMRRFLAQSQFDPTAVDGGRQHDAGTGARTITGPRDDRTISELKSAQVQLEMELTRARAIFLPSSEAVQSLERSLRQTQERVGRELGRNADNYAQFNQLDRLLRTAESRLTELRRRHAEIELFVQINRQPASTRLLIDPVLVPNRSDWERRLLVGMTGPCVGLLLGFGFVGLREMADSTLRSRRDVRRHLGVDVVAVIPRASNRELRHMRDYVGAASDSPLLSSRWAPVIETLVQRVAHGVKPRDARGRSVLVTSAVSGEGKTFAAALLAEGLSRFRFGKVLLVDADVDSSRPGRRVQPRRDPSLAFRSSQGRAGDTPGLEDGALAVLPGETMTDVAADLTGGRLRDLLQRERQAFDWIVFDGGPIGRGAINVLASEVDIVLLVIAAEDTPRAAVRDALESLDVNDRHVQAVLNKARHSSRLGFGGH